MLGCSPFCWCVYFAQHWKDLFKGKRNWGFASWGSQILKHNYCRIFTPWIRIVFPQNDVEKGSLKMFLGQGELGPEDTVAEVALQKIRPTNRAEWSIAPTESCSVPKRGVYQGGILWAEMAHLGDSVTVLQTIPPQKMSDGKGYGWWILVSTHSLPPFDEHALLWWLVDVIGVVQNVSSTMSIRRKSNNEMIPKRDITIADETKKTVVVSLWSDLATNVGQELLDMADKSPVVAIKSLKVGDFQGLSLSAITRSTVLVNPDMPEAKKLRSWYDCEGKETSLTSVGSGLSSSAKGVSWSMYSDRVSLLHITSNPNLGEDKPVFFSVKANISFIKPDQAMWYRACKTCNKKVTEAIGSGYWCEGCQKNDTDCSLRYIVAMRVSDASGEAWLSVFNEQAEKIIGCSADELDRLKSQDGDSSAYQMKLKEATWVPYLFRVSVTPQEYNNEKRQRITVRAVAPVDFAAESRYLLEEMAKMNISVGFL
nr:replication protein A 70 kDa DNA-binding subunit B [Ipomoea batatas]